MARLEGDVEQEPATRHRLYVCAVYRRGVVALSMYARACLVVRVPYVGAALRGRVDRVSKCYSESKGGSKARDVWRDSAIATASCSRQRTNASCFRRVLRTRALPAKSKCKSQGCLVSQAASHGPQVVADAS
jgi:hypothetical protein